MDEMSTFEYVKILYNTLIEARGREFDKSDYYWSIGVLIIKELFERLDVPQNENVVLFGIEVRFSYRNPHEIKLYEDITNKIAIPYSENEEVQLEDMKKGGQC